MRPCKRTARVESTEQVEFLKIRLKSIFVKTETKQHLLDSTETETESMLGSADKKNTWFDVFDQGLYINKDSSSITLGIMILLAISKHAK